MVKNIKEESSEVQETTTEVKKSELISRLRANPWIVSTAVLALATIILLVLSVSPSLTGNVISEASASVKLVDFLNNKVGGGVTLVSSKNLGSIYEVTVSYQGEEIPVYISKDGQYFIQGATPLSTEADSTDSTPAQQTQVEVPKSDKPKVELFVWGYCPYGVQAQGPLAEVAKLLKGQAEFNAVLYYDGHGPFETQQNKIQACIQKLNKDKYWDYASGFVETIYPKCSSSRDIECDKTESVKLMKSLGIDSSKVLSCVDSQGAGLIEAYSTLAQGYGVTGSPTLVVNGVIVQPSARTADAFKTAVCSAFNTAPDACEQALSSAAAAAAGSC